MKIFAIAIGTTITLACHQSAPPPAEQPIVAPVASVSPATSSSLQPSTDTKTVESPPDGGGGVISLANIGTGVDAGAGKKKSPSLRQGATQVNGRLPPEVIQRVVRQNFGGVRKCYEVGLAKDPNLQGRVATKFVIDRAGAVSSTADGGSDLPDQSVVTCVIGVFAGLKFPQPEGGIVTVVYPIIFNPGD